jgi:hypothetical protein
MQCGRGAQIGSKANWVSSYQFPRMVAQTGDADRIQHTLGEQLLVLEDDGANHANIM